MIGGMEIVEKVRELENENVQAIIEPSLEVMKNIINNKGRKRVLMKTD